MDHPVAPHAEFTGTSAVMVILSAILLLLVLAMCGFFKKMQSRRNTELEGIIAKLNKQHDLSHPKPPCRDEHGNNNLDDVEMAANYSDAVPVCRDALKKDGIEDDEMEIYGNMEIKEELAMIGKGQYTLGEKITTGSFAVIHRATIRKNEKHIAVAAKFPKSYNDHNKKLLTARMNFLANQITRHVNVISLVAVDTSMSIMFLDLCEEGTMSSWVKNLDHLTQETDDLMVKFCLDIVNGLKHLHSLKVLHRRLGIRNVLLKNTPVRLLVKLTGFGPLENEIYSTSKKQDKVPFKWLPPESIERLSVQPRIYNEAVDMWSYGITLWEMYSKGEMPYKAVKSWQLKPLLESGERLPCHKECIPSMYDKVMMTCWALDPTERPSAADICTTLSKLFLGENDKDYYYAAGMAAGEDIEFYAYSERQFGGIHENNPGQEEVDCYVESDPRQDTYINGGDLQPELYENSRKEPIYLQLIG